jgi:hypothetical protein
VAAAKAAHVPAAKAAHVAGVSASEMTAAELAAAESRPRGPSFRRRNVWGKPTQAVEANVSVFDQMTDDEPKTMLAALEALKGD